MGKPDLLHSVEEHLLVGWLARVPLAVESTGVTSKQPELGWCPQTVDVTVRTYIH